MKENECKLGSFWIKFLAVIGAVTIIAGIAYAIYRYFTPDYLEDLEDDFDDYFEADDFEDDDNPMADFEKEEDEE